VQHDRSHCLSFDHDAQFVQRLDHRCHKGINPCEF
jgi:hypothetical protein